MKDEGEAKMETGRKGRIGGRVIALEDTRERTLSRRRSKRCGENENF